jgi:hypothetical protein
MAQGAMHELIVATLLRSEMFHDDVSLNKPVQCAGVVKRMEYSKSRLTAQNWYAHSAEPLA